MKKRRIVQRAVVHHERARDRVGFVIRYTLECGHIVERRRNHRTRCRCEQCGTTNEDNT